MRYDVVIYKYADGRIESIIGSDMTRERAERREETGLARCNSNYGTAVINHDPRRKKGDLLPGRKDEKKS